MLRSSLCGYSDVYIVFSGTITVSEVAASGVIYNIQVLFKNCASFTDCISEINNTEIYNAKNIHV